MSLFKRGNGTREYDPDFGKPPTKKHLLVAGKFQKEGISSTLLDKPENFVSSTAKVNLSDKIRLGNTLRSVCDEVNVEMARIGNDYRVATIVGNSLGVYSVNPADNVPQTNNPLEFGTATSLLSMTHIAARIDIDSADLAKDIAAELVKALDNKIKQENKE